MGRVSDQIREPMMAALAIVRGQLLELTGDRSTRDVLESNVLEVASSEDPLAVVRALGVIGAQAMILASALAAAANAGNPASAMEILDVIEQTIRGKS